MRLASGLRAHFVVGAALCVTLVSRVVVAQPADASAVNVAAPAASTAPTEPLEVWVDVQSATFDKARLKESLEHELGREVVLTDSADTSAVQIRFEGTARVGVHYTTPSGEKLSRTVDLPPDRERSVQVVSWLTVNLVRDEASELLDELRARRKATVAADERAAAERAAADKAAADKAAADRAAAEQAAAAAAKNAAEQAKRAENAASAPKNQDGLLRDPLRSVDFALVTPMSLLRDSPKRELKLQLALGYGESGAIYGAAFSPALLKIRHDLLGGAVGLGAVFVGGNARGIVMAMGLSEVDGTLEGVQIGTGVAVQRGGLMRGALLAVGGAVAGDVNGVLAGAGIAMSRSLQGASTSAGLNVVRGPSLGLLLAGGANFTADHRGVEIAGGFNASRDLDGIALAPINVHRRVRGLQFGVVNIAEEVDGAAIGVLSLAKNGRFQPTVWTSTDGSVHVGVKSIAGYAFTQIGAGIDLDAAAFMYDAGVGAHFRVTQNVFFEPGVHYSATNETSNAAGAPDEHQLHYLGQFGYRVGDKVDFLAAGGVRHTISGGSGARVAPELRAGVAFF